VANLDLVEFFLPSLLSPPLSPSLPFLPSLLLEEGPLNPDWGWLSKAWRPTKHIKGHIGDGFYGSNDPTNSVKALKEDRSKGLGFNPIRSTPPGESGEQCKLPPWGLGRALAEIEFGAF